jgi:tetratricopeptide (TPR) repeat protein
VPAELQSGRRGSRPLSAFQRSPISSSSTQDLLPLVWIPALIAALLLALQTATRRTAALVGLALMVFDGRVAAQRPAPGTQDYAAGRMKEAAERLSRRLNRSASDTAWYNAGTAQLAAGDYAKARQSLAQAAKSLDPDLRYRALYNSGVAALKQVQTDTAGRDSLLTEASGFLKDGLSLSPSSARAKWNLELAQRHKPPPTGGGNRNRPPPPPQGQPPPDPSRGQPPPRGCPASVRPRPSRFSTRWTARSGHPEPTPGQIRATASGVKDW